MRLLIITDVQSSIVPPEFPFLMRINNQRIQNFNRIAELNLAKLEWEAVVIGSYYVISGIGIAPFWQCLLFGRRRLINYWVIHFFISDTHGAVCTSEWPWAYETFHWTTFIAYGIPSSNIICNDITESRALLQSRSLLSILWPRKALRRPTGWGKSKRGKTKEEKASYVADIYKTLCGYEVYRRRNSARNLNSSISTTPFNIALVREIEDGYK